MEIKVRDVDAVAVKKIDEIAKKKGMSRQEFLKRQIESLAFYRQQTTREMELSNLINKNIQVMRDCYDAMEKMNHFVDLMMEVDEA